MALTTPEDGFETICKIATIAQPPYMDDTGELQVDIYWGDVDEAVIDPNMEFVMVESCLGYFEAVHHTLVGLQMAADIK